MYLHRGAYTNQSNRRLAVCWGLPTKRQLPCCYPQQCSVRPRVHARNVQPRPVELRIWKMEFGNWMSALGFHSTVYWCAIYNCMHSSRMIVVCHEDYQRRQVNAQTHGVYGFSLLRQWICSCPATCLHTASVWIRNQKRPKGSVTVLLFCDVHVDMGVTQNSCVLLWICGYRAMQTKYGDTTSTAGYVANVTI